MEILELIPILIDVVLFVLLVLTLLFGFIRGTIRTAIRTGITLLLIFIASLVATPIAKSVLNAENPFSIFDENVTVIEGINQIVADSLFDSNVDKLTETGLDEVIYDLSFSVAKLAVTFALSIVVLLIFAPLIKLIVMSILKVIRKRKPKLLSRFGGLAIGLASYLIIFSIIVLPIFGAVEVAKVTINEVAYISEDVKSTNEDIGEFTSHSVTYKMTSSIGKTKKTNFGIGGKRFGKFISIKTKKGKVNVIHDLDKILPLVKRVASLYNKIESTENINEKIALITEDDLTTVIDGMKDSEIIRYLYPYAIRYLEAESKNIDVIKDLELDYTKLAEIDFNNDIATSYHFLSSILQLMKRLDLEKLDDYDQYLTDENVTNIKDIITYAMDISLFKECLPNVACYYLKEISKDSEYKEIIGLITPEYVNNAFTADLEKLAKIYTDLEKAGIIEFLKNDESELIFTTETEKLLLQAKDKILDIQLFKGQYPFILQQFETEIKKILSLNIEEIVKEDADWNLEMDVLLEVLVYVLEMGAKCDLDEPSTLLKNATFANCIKKIVEPFKKSRLAEKYYYPAIIKYVNDSFKGSFMEDYLELVTPNYLQNGFSTDIDALIYIYNEALDLKLFDIFEEGSNVTLDLSNPKIKNRVEIVLTKMINLLLFVDHEEKLFETLYKSTDLNNYVQFKELDPSIDWSQEKTLLVGIIIDLIDLGLDAENINIDITKLNESEEIINQFAVLFDHMYESKVTRPYVFELLDVIIHKSGFDFEFSEADKQNIVNNTMQKEMQVWLEIMKQVTETFGADAINGNIDIHNLNGSSIASMMKTASESYIASKVIGKLLNDALGENGLNIQPKDEVTGEAKYDFTDPTVLLEQADAIGSLIDLANSVDTIYDQIQNNGELTSEQIRQITQSISELPNQQATEIVNDIISNICQNNEVVISENVDWQAESQVINEVLTTYQEAEDKENFNVNDNPELAETVSNSEVVSALLEYFGLLN